MFLTIPIPGRSGKSWRKRARALIIDSGYTLLVFLLFVTPGFALNVISAFGFPGGDLAGLYNQVLFPWLGICGGNIATPINPVCGTPYVPGLLQNIIGGLVSILITVMLLYLTTVAVAITWGLLSALGMLEPLGIVQGLIGAIGSFITGIAGLVVTYQILGYMPVITLAPAALFVTVGTYYLAEFVKLNWSTLMAWGAVIYILPFKLGRKAGAALIATSLVLYVALPAMPLFVGMLSNTGSAQQAIILMQQNSPDVQSGLLSAYRPSDLYFALSSRGLLPTDYYALHVEDTSGRSWTIWSDKSGYGDYPLPTGSYTVTGIEFLGVLVGFQADQPNFNVEQAATNLQAPSETAMVRGLLDIYQFNLTKVQLIGSGHTAPFSATFFLQMRSWRGAVVKGVDQYGAGSDSVNSTVCAPEGASSDNVMHGEIFVPSFTNLLGITSSQVAVSLGGDQMQLYSTGTQSRLGLGAVYAFDAPLAGCLPLDIKAQSIGWPLGFDYQRQNVDPTGYQPPQVSSSQQSGLISSLDALTYYFAANIILPSVYVTVILTGLSIGLARLIMRKQF